MLCTISRANVASLAWAFHDLSGFRGLLGHSKKQSIYWLVAERHNTSMVSVPDVAWHTKHVQTSTPTGSPPSSYKWPQETHDLDEHDDFSDWMLLGGSIRSSTQLDHAMPHSSIGADTRRDDSRNGQWHRAKDEPMTGEAWGMDEEDLLELSRQARQEGLVIKGVTESRGLTSARPLTVDTDSQSTPESAGNHRRHGYQMPADRPVIIVTKFP